MSKSDLRKKAEIAPNTMTKLRRDEEVSLTKVIDVVCKIIDEVSFAGTDSVYAWHDRKNGRTLTKSYGKFS
mgnify:CR=1 FL=1